MSISASILTNVQIVRDSAVGSQFLWYKSDVWRIRCPGIGKNSPERKKGTREQRFCLFSSKALYAPPWSFSIFVSFVYPPGFLIVLFNKKDKKYCDENNNQMIDNNDAMQRE